MISLLVCAQDIREIAFGLVEDGRLTQEVLEHVPPERYLEALDRTLANWQVKLNDFSAIAVVAGPGAFTASRLSTMIANTLAFTANLPIIPLENPGRLSLADLAASLPSTRTTFAMPVYDRPPNITRKVSST